MAEEISGAYLRGYSKTKKRNTSCPLYRNPPDNYLWMDTFVKLPVSQDTLGVYYAPVVKANHETVPDGGPNISKTINPGFSRSLHSDRKRDLFGEQTITVENYTYVDISVSITASMSYGAKSDGWCWNYTYLYIDGNTYDQWYTTRSDSGTRSHSWSRSKVLLAPGTHTIGIYTITNGSDGDPASFSCNNMTWNITNYRTKTQLTDMHCKIGNQEYIFAAGPGY